MLIETIVIKTEYKEFVKYKKSELKIDRQLSERSEEMWKYSKEAERDNSQAEEINRLVEATGGSAEKLN